MKYAVVTGGTKGIGKAVLLTFAKMGFNVITCGRSSNAIEALQKTIEDMQTNNKLYACTADLSTFTGRMKFCNFVKENTSSVEVLINNAGVYVPGQILQESEGALEFMLQANLLSAYDITRNLISLMQNVVGAHIFNMCSTASIIPYVNGGSYCIAKHALLGFNKVLREELKYKKIKVTAILPGATRTASWDGVNLDDAYFMQAQDIADLIWSAYQLSPSACVEELLVRPLPGDIPA